LAIGQRHSDKINLTRSDCGQDRAGIRLVNLQDNSVVTGKTSRVYVDTDDELTRKHELWLHPRT